MVAIWFRNLPVKQKITLAQTGTDISGRGVGMDVVKSNVRKRGASILGGGGVVLILDPAELMMLAIEEAL